MLIVKEALIKRQAGGVGVERVLENDFDSGEPAVIEGGNRRACRSADGQSGHVRCEVIR
jgi:hypothetical protein